MYLSLISLPLFGSIISGFFGRKVGISGSELITITCVILTTIMSIFVFFEVGFNSAPVSLDLFTWIGSESLHVLWGFNFDSLTASMLIPVLIVSSLVHIYSVGYMGHDPHIQRFFSYLSLFSFMMVILVTANNYLVMFVGWEGVGICSYLLVNFWFTRLAANLSSISALLTNRVGDCFLTIGMFGILLTFGNLDYATVFSLVPLVNEDLVTLIGICLLIGAMAKSSQIGLHVWLPMAMEGPTPVSALIHAATMVTAGVYLLMRNSPLIEYSQDVLTLCLWTGAITSLLSSMIGLFQKDIKKVIAYSTMSQLGLMVTAIGLSSYATALFHLMNHAFYKALLFLGAGSVIHAVKDNQDLRKYGGLRVFLPLTYSVMLIASLSLAAFPFMTGFYSKDPILESCFGIVSYSGTVAYILAVVGAMFTTLYSVKVLFLTFLASPSGPKVSYEKAHEGDAYMSIPLIVLSVFSIFFGYICKDIYMGLGSGFFSDNSIFIHPVHELVINTEFAVPTAFKLLPLIFTLTLTVSSLIVLEFLPAIIISFVFTYIGYSIYSLFNQKLYIELFYNENITEVVLKLGGQTTKVLDNGSVESLGPFGLWNGLSHLSSRLASLDTGVITSYALYILIGLIFYMLTPYLALNNVLMLIIFASFGYIGIYEYKSLNINDLSASSPSSSSTSTSELKPLYSSLFGFGQSNGNKNSTKNLLYWSIIIAVVMLVQKLVVRVFLIKLGVALPVILLFTLLLAFLTLMLLACLKGEQLTKNKILRTSLIIMAIFYIFNYTDIVSVMNGMFWDICLNPISLGLALAHLWDIQGDKATMGGECVKPTLPCHTLMESSDNDKSYEGKGKGRADPQPNPSSGDSSDSDDVPEGIGHISDEYDYDDIDSLTPDQKKRKYKELNIRKARAAIRSERAANPTPKQLKDIISKEMADNKRDIKEIKSQTRITDDDRRTLQILRERLKGLKANDTKTIEQVRHYEKQLADDEVDQLTGDLGKLRIQRDRDAGRPLDIPEEPESSSAARARGAQTEANKRRKDSDPYLNTESDQKPSKKSKGEKEDQDKGKGKGKGKEREE